MSLPGSLRNIDNQPVFAPTRVSVVVSAVDRNYYDYHRTRSDPFTPGSVAAGLTGGQGVFGSLVVLTRRTLDVR